MSLPNYDSLTAPNHHKIGPQKRPLFRYADTVGDGTGNPDAIGDYEGNPTDFKIKPNPGEIIRLARAILLVEDSGSFDSGFYGNGLTLTNGLRPYFQTNGVRRYFVSGGQPPILTSGDVAGFCHDLELRTWGAGNQFLTARWTFTKAGIYFRVVGDTEDEFGIELSDDFSGLEKHRFMMQGYYE